jgi:hypothetical protein
MPHPRLASAALIIRLEDLVVVMRRQIKNDVAHVGKNRNPCYELAVADLRPHDSGAEADYR